MRSTYCCLLAEEDACDETTWGVHLLDLTEQGLDVDCTVADGGKALCAGQAAAWGAAVPCHGDVFHAERDIGLLAFYLEHQSAGCTHTHEKLERQMTNCAAQPYGIVEEVLRPPEIDTSHFALTSPEKSRSSEKGYSLD